MRNSLLTSSTLTLGLVLTASSAVSQSNDTEQNLFVPENAIVDTSIPFVLGAHEEQQSLRSSFGWPTFQEGQVEGTYFRFDPDGYARFSPSPRLDTNVFEVLCEPGTFICSASKGFLNFGLNEDNFVKIKLDGFQPNDQVFISDGETEFELPITPNGILDNDLERIFSNGGDLIVKRGETEVERTSLTSFFPTVTYLKWLSAAQSADSFPETWPTPSGASDQPSLETISQSLGITLPSNVENSASETNVVSLEDNSLLQNTVEPIEPTSHTQDIAHLTLLVEKNALQILSLENKFDELESLVQEQLKTIEDDSNMSSVIDITMQDGPNQTDKDADLNQTDIVAELLRQLDGKTQISMVSPQKIKEPVVSISQDDYMVLSEYLRSRLAALE